MPEPRTPAESARMLAAALEAALDDVGIGGGARRRFEQVFCRKLEELQAGDEEVPTDG